eukprot:CAMPEP_0184039308 /NCGR_PEP_ID=MMETSP0955-20130417/52014_1 /TAXON_ID=627963 /ORGANISM="Aplanochytrium sp, Strain PBS07" /LENGTH=334 /DNA_ID=CAMNT_0026328415 /DNA_START=62 /DNA_END=1066 /DNA_ORIENTATION=-
MHVSAILDLVNSGAVVEMLKELTKLVNEVVNLKLIPYVVAIGEILPEIRLTKYQTGTEFSLLSFQSQLNPLLLYEDLSCAFDCFKYVGNATGFYRLLQVEVDKKQLFSFVQLAPFVGFVKKLRTSSVDRPEDIKVEDMSLYKTINAISKQRGEIVDDDMDLVRNLCLSEFKSIAERNSVLPMFLHSIKRNLLASLKENESLSKFLLKEVFSSFQFIHCNGLGSFNYLGDGFHWGGVLLLFILNPSYHLEKDLISHILRIEYIQRESSHKTLDTLEESTTNPAMFVKSAEDLKEKNSRILATLVAATRWEGDPCEAKSFHPSKWTPESAYGIDKT